LKHLQAIKLSLARSTSLLWSGKMWNPEFGHLPLPQSRLNHLCFRTLGHKVFSHRLKAFSYVWNVVWQLTTSYWKVPISGFAQSDKHLHLHVEFCKFLVALVVVAIEIS
jgi:hypothetical protein